MREMRCHCGNVTTIGHAVYRSSPLALDGHCLLCRCDEHWPDSHAARAIHSSTSTRTGCGPTCRFRPARERKTLLAGLASRDITRDLALWYKRLAELGQEYIEV